MTAEEMFLWSTMIHKWTHVDDIFVGLCDARTGHPDYGVDVWRGFTEVRGYSAGIAFLLDSYELISPTRRPPCEVLKERMQDMLAKMEHYIELMVKTANREADASKRAKLEFVVFVATVILAFNKVLVRRFCT